MLPMVLLLHELPDGSSHFDWMLQPRPGAALVTFRVEHRLDTAVPLEFLALRLPDHREHYLSYEGPVHAPSSSGQAPPPVSSAVSPHQMGARGRVRRVAHGLCAFEQLSSLSARVRACFDPGERFILLGTPLAPRDLAERRLPRAVGGAPADSASTPWIFRLSREPSSVILPAGTPRGE